MSLDRVIEEAVSEILQRQTATKTKRLYSAKEAAVYLGRSASSVQNMVHNGTLTPVRLDDSPKLYFDRADLDRLIDDAKAGRVRLRRPAATVNCTAAMLGASARPSDPKPQSVDLDHAEANPQANPRQSVSARLSRPPRRKKDEPNLVDQVLRWGPNV